jgi:murein DD-endopeptidase MepM/ murein hydrolase activator NlpD
VIQAGHVQDYGTTIIVNHGQDVHTLYGHLSKLNVQSGQRVERGALIGYTGNTGRLLRPAPALRDRGPRSVKSEARWIIGRETHGGGAPR